MHTVMKQPVTEPRKRGDLWLGEGSPCFPEFLGEAVAPEKSVSPLPTHRPVQMTLPPPDVFARRPFGLVQGQRLAAQQEKLAPHTGASFGKEKADTPRKGDLFQRGHVAKLQ